MAKKSCFQRLSRFFNYQRIFFLFLGFLLGINIFLFFSWGDCEITRRKLFQQPENITLRLKLVGCLLEAEKYDLADLELSKLEEEFSQDINSTNSFKRQQLMTYKTRLHSLNPQLQSEEILFWKKRVLETPNYPDGWVSLALLWYQQGDEQKAKLAIAKACRFDSIREDIGKVAEQMGFSCSF